MAQNYYIIKISIKDMTDKRTVTFKVNQDSPTINEFAKCCYEAGKVYGFTESQLDTCFKYDDEDNNF